MDVLSLGLGIEVHAAGLDRDGWRTRERTRGEVRVCGVLERVKRVEESPATLVVVVVRTSCREVVPSETATYSPAIPW